MADGLLRRKVKEENLAVFVDSAGNPGKNREAVRKRVTGPMKSS